MRLLNFIIILIILPLVTWAQTPLYNFTFTGGMQGWTTNSIECEGAASDKAQWMWVEDGIIDQGAYSDFGLLNSRTPDSGIIMLNSDFLDNNGLDDNLGNGDCAAPQIAELISPSMDFSNEDTVLVSFNQLYSRFLGYYNDDKDIDESSKTATFVGVSSDGGQSWTDIPVNEELRNFRATRNYDAEITLDITDMAAGKSDVMIKLMWKGDYYLWAVDDVRLYGGRMDDLEIAAFKYPASNFETPIGQLKLDTMRFIADVVNLGLKAVDSAYLYITVRGNEENDRKVYFQDSVLIEDMVYNDTMEVHLPNYFLPEQFTPGSYAFIYRLRNTKRPVEVNLANNIRADVFIASEDVFRKTDRGDGFGYSIDGDYIIGNYYRINPLFGERLVLDNINFSAFPTGQDKMVGMDVIVYLLKIDDDVAPDLSDWNRSKATDDKKTIVGIGTYTFTDSDVANTDLDFRFKATEFLNFEDDGAPIVLEPGARYIAAIEYTGDANKLIHNLSERVTYYSVLGPDQFSTMIYEYNRSNWFTNGFGDGLVAVVGMDMMLEMTANEPLLSKEEVLVFPNPTSDYIRVRMNFDSPQSVNVYLTDVSGKILKMTNRAQFLSDTIEIDVEGIPSGTYFLNISSKEGMRTEKISVFH